MKQIIILILTLIISSCSVTKKLNKSIDKSQRASLKNSPFETASGITDELKMQKKYRIQYEVDLKGLIDKHPVDTIILIENYDFICIGCPADRVEIFINNMLIAASLH